MGDDPQWRVTQQSSASGVVNVDFDQGNLMATFIRNSSGSNRATVGLLDDNGTAIAINKG